MKRIFSEKSLIFAEKIGVVLYLVCGCAYGSRKSAERSVCVLSWHLGCTDGTLGESDVSLAPD